MFCGAAMALAYHSRRVTRDVDALFKPHGIVHDEALAVAAELGLPRWWLNEQASSYDRKRQEKTGTIQVNRTRGATSAAE